MRRTGEHHLFIGLIYIPPRGSSSEQRSNSPPPFDVLQQVVADALAQNGFIVLAGDFNARTGSAAGTRTADFSGILDSSIQPRPEAHLSLPQRQSADSHTCAYGKTLLQLSEAADLHILNGRTADDADGHFTCRTAQGSSVVDYFLASAALLNPMPAMVVVVVGDKCAESDHCPLTLQMSLQGDPCNETEIRPQQSTTKSTVTIETIRFDTSKLQQYRSTLQHFSHSFFSVPPSQCCLASALQSCMVQAALLSFFDLVESPCTNQIRTVMMRSARVQECNSCLQEHRDRNA